MKAKPVRIIQGEGYVECSKEDATHLTILIPSHSHPLTLPVITKGKRDGTGCWTWNGSTEAPTLRPSVLTINNGDGFRCHSWITDGQAQYLGDCSHSMAGKIVDLLESA